MISAALDAVPRSLYEPREGGVSTPVFRVGAAIARAAITMAGGVEVIGGENLLHDGPYIAAASHRWEAESGIFGATIDGITGRQTEFLINQFTWNLGRTVLGEEVHSRDLLKLLGVRPVSSDGNTAESITSVVKHGGILGIYPEGRVYQGRQIAPLKRGVAQLALSEQVPIVPIAFGGVNYGNYGRLVMVCLPVLCPPLIQRPGEEPKADKLAAVRPDDQPIVLLTGDIKTDRKTLRGANNELLETLSAQLQSALDIANAVSSATPSSIRSYFFSRLMNKHSKVPPLSRPEAKD